MENDPFGPKGTPSEWPWRLTRHSELKSASNFGESKFMFAPRQKSSLQDR